MHTQYEKEKYTKTWDAKLNNLHQMKLHIKEYSYRDAKYKFEDFDFCGDNFWTIEVHNKKYHSENLECGLFEFLAIDRDELDTHLSTCEIYD